jgi:hypothetical protein
MDEAFRLILAAMIFLSTYQKLTRLVGLERKKWEFIDYECVYTSSILFWSCTYIFYVKCLGFARFFTGEFILFCFCMNDLNFNALMSKSLKLTKEFNK